MFVRERVVEEVRTNELLPPCACTPRRSFSDASCSLRWQQLYCACCSAVMGKEYGHTSWFWLHAAVWDAPGPAGHDGWPSTAVHWPVLAMLVHFSLVHEEHSVSTASQAELPTHDADWSSACAWNLAFSYCPAWVRRGAAGEGASGRKRGLERAQRQGAAGQGTHVGVRVRGPRRGVGGGRGLRRRRGGGGLRQG